MQPGTNSEDRRRRRQGRRSNVPNRLTTAGLRLPRQPVTANGATTPGFSGPFPSHSGVFGPPPLFVRCSPRCFESTLTVGSLGRQPGSFESAPFVAWSVFGSPPFRTVRHCTGQVATDPQSPKGGSQRACPTWGAHPTASGLHGTVAVRPLSLWFASPGDTSEPPLMNGPWDVALW